MADNNNPRNANSTLFRRLTRLFSGPIVNYDRPAVTRGTRRDVAKYTFTGSTGKAFKKKEYYNPFGDLNNKVLLQRNRQLRYTDFDQMEYVPEIASALDIYADEITTSTVFSPLVNIDCHNREIKDILETLLYTVMNVNANMFSWARSMCKYGDYYLYLDIDDEMGITNVIPLPLREIERIEGTDITNPNYIQYFWQQAEGRGKGVTFENWQVAHFRVMGSDRYVPYGTSVLEPSRRIWRQLTLLEDAMMAYRIVRSPERRVFYIDVGNIAAEDVEQYIEQVKTQMKRNQVVSENEGRVDLRYNAMSVEEDYYIPVRGSSNNTRIETLAGGQFTGDIDDVNYLRDKLFSALKVPKAYLANTDTMEDKTTLSQKDIRFARTIQRLQRTVVAELEKICIIHLYTLGFRNNDLMSFKLNLNNPSKIAELQELEHLRVKFEIATGATEGLFSRRWVYQNIFKLSEEEVQRIEMDQFGDAKHAALIEAAAMPEGDQGELGDDGLGGIGGGELGGAMPAGDDGGGEMAAGGEEEGPLLSQPDDGTPPANRSDKRGMGARRRSMRAKGSHEMGTATMRNIEKGHSDGMSTLINIGENQESDEELIFETQRDILQLIEQLETKNEGKA
tara:strand:- start:2901 stop:4760 length:1860 start_codon:yes stop_codon:yes gene_type:complete